MTELQDTVSQESILVHDDIVTVSQESILIHDDVTDEDSFTHKVGHFPSVSNKPLNVLQLYLKCEYISQGMEFKIQRVVNLRNVTVIIDISHNIQSSFQDTQSEQVQFCEGLSTKDPILKNFPFQLLSEEWASHIVVNNNRIHHQKCFEMHYMIDLATNDTVNQCCSDLEYNTVYKNICSRAAKSHDAEDCFGLQNKYLTYSQTQSRMKKIEELKRDLILKGLNNKRSLKRLGDTLTVYQRLVHLIATNDVPGVQRLIKVAVNNQRSVHHIVSKVLDAIDGIYRARHSEGDKDLAFLVFKLGGPTLLDICFKANMLPSVSTAYRLAQSLKPFQSPITWTVKECFSANIEDSFVNSHALSLKIDETYGTPRIRFDDKTNSLQGICYLHGRENPDLLNFETYEEALQIQDALKSGTIHIPKAKDNTVVGINKLNEVDGVKAVLCWPTCCKDDYKGTENIFVTISDEVYRRTGKNVMNYCTDADGVRRLVLERYLCQSIDSMSPVGEIIVKLPLVDTKCGKRQETANFDAKHIGKRMWLALINETVELSGIKVVRNDLVELLLLADGVEKLEVERLLYPTDKQNLAAATKFCILFIEVMRNTDKHNKLPFKMQSIIPELQLHAEVIDGLLHFYVYSQTSLVEQLAAISKASYTLFALYKITSGGCVNNPL